MKRVSPALILLLFSLSFFLTTCVYGAGECELALLHVTRLNSLARAKVHQRTKGILIGLPPERAYEPLKIQKFSWKLEENDPAHLSDDKLVLQFTDSKGRSWSVEMHPGVFTVAAAQAIDGRPVLTTLTAPVTEGRSLSHPAIDGHRFSFYAAVIDRWGFKVPKRTLRGLEDESRFLLRENPIFHSTSWFVEERPWHLRPEDFSLPAASTRSCPEDKALFQFAWRGVVEDEVANLMSDPEANELYRPLMSSPIANREIFQNLTLAEEEVARRMNEYIVVNRIVRSVFNHYIQGIPEGDLESLIERLGPHYQANLDADQKGLDAHANQFIQNSDTIPTPYRLRSPK